MNSGIYIIKNIVNGKYYVGRSVNLTKRLQSHKQLLHKNNHYNIYLQNSFNLYGESNFLFKVLLKCEEKELAYFEKFYCDLFNSHNKNRGYNIEPITVNEKIKRSSETLEKLRIAKLGTKHTEETKLKMSQAQKGRKTSSETKIKISNAFKIPLIVMGLNNNILFEFNSIYDAGIYLNIKPAYISERLRTKIKRYKNFIFIRKKDFDPNKDYSLPQRDFSYLHKKIISIDKQNNTKTFNSIKEAALFYKTAIRTISRVLRGERKQNNGIKFMYLEVYENNSVLPLKLKYD